MSAKYEIYADEAWTHGGDAPGRYHTFYGGIFGTESDLGRFDTTLRTVIQQTGITGEIKWTNLRPSNVAGYKLIVQCLFDHVDQGNIRYRQMFCDRALVRVVPYGESPPTDLDVQFKLCYQFLKHSFGVEYLDRAVHNEVLVRLDTHSSQKHKNNLRSFVQGIPATLSHPNLVMRVTYERSERVPRIQICDLLMGAAGAYGNRTHEVRTNGARGMTKKQKARLELAKFIYDGLRKIDANGRGSKVFHWFESTGKDGDRTNLLRHAIRIWKFKPRAYRIDRGWERDHLEKLGKFVSEIDPRVHYVGSWELSY